jgi:P4 family phage/plasmid primase-like protien
MNTAVVAKLNKAPITPRRPVQPLTEWMAEYRRSKVEGEAPRPRARVKTPAPPAVATMNATIEQEHPKQAFERGDHAELAGELRRTYGRPLVTSEGAIWVYDRTRGIWSSEGVERALRTTIVERFAGIPAGPKAVPLRVNNADVEGVIKIVKLLTEDAKFFASAPAGVACENGFVTLDGVVPHSDTHRARTHYPLAFAPDARSQRWEKFLDDLFRDDSDKAQKIACLQEVFGGALFGLSTRFQKCAVATGGGSNGKSTLFTIIRTLFPDGKVQAIPPKKWEHGFTLANFRGTLLNLVSDMPHGAIIDSEHFKEIIAGDVVTAEEKHKPAFSLRPIAGHVFACNELPATSDHSFGFWRRFLVIPFLRNFEDDPARDTMIAEKIIATERAGVLAWLVTGARRLDAAKTYTVPASHAAAMTKWQNEANTVGLFKAECTAPWPKLGTGIQASRLYALYRNWAELGGFKSVARTQFAQRMAALGCPSQKKEDGNWYPLVCTHREQETRYRKPQ